MSKPNRSALARKLRKAKKRARIAEHDLKHVRGEAKAVILSARAADRKTLDEAIAWAKAMEEKSDSMMEVAEQAQARLSEHLNERTVEKDRTVQRLTQERDDALAGRKIGAERIERLSRSVDSKGRYIDDLERRITNCVETIDWQVQQIRVLKRGAQILRTGHVHIKSAKNAAGNPRIDRLRTLAINALAEADAVE